MTTRKAVLITGAAGDIGRALCGAFHAAGWFVVATDRRAARPPCDAFIRLDLRRFVASAAVRAQFAKRIRKAKGRLPLRALVNNAATQLPAGASAIRPEDFQESISVNVTAPLLMVKTVLADLKRTCGSVINIGSIHSSLTKPGFVSYATSKAALQGLTTALSVDLGRSGVRVNLIRPAATRTAMLESGFRGRHAARAALGRHHPLARIAEPRDIADAAVFLASDTAGFITGAMLDVAGGISGRLHDPA
jgi:NAD(P)-dependent dehydrogenase (short-subunit alcohol dehydrogenase family)